MPTILITGANRGLGLEFTHQYANDGWHVIACCRTPADADDLQAIAAEHPLVTLEALDVKDHDAIDALGAKYAGHAIDVLLNNAGIIGPIPIADHVERQKFGAMDYAIWHDVIATNTFGPLKMAETFVEHVGASEQKKIVNISSQTGSIAEMSIPSIAYASSKTALNRAMTIVADELKKRDIIVALFCPGYAKTRMDAFGYAMVEVKDSVSALRPRIAALTLDDAGTFTRYDGKPIAW
jgi:NAD(P)-dependent dehydrogenase (short-subunit alcohol dehydrogenase family)